MKVSAIMWQTSRVSIRGRPCRKFSVC